MTCKHGCRIIIQTIKTKSVLGKSTLLGTSVWATHTLSIQRIIRVATAVNRPVVAVNRSVTAVDIPVITVNTYSNY